MKRIIVAHPAQQHSYKTAEALADNNLLFKYITSVYRKEDSITNKVTFFLKGDAKKRALRRKNENIRDSDIVLLNELSGIFLLFLQRFKILKRFYDYYWEYHNKKFNISLKKYVRDHQKEIGGIIVYDQVSADFFSEELGIPVILDMSAPSIVFMVNNFAKFGVGINKYSDLITSCLVEIHGADLYLAASSVTKKSLEILGVESEKIILAPYGIEPVTNSEKTYANNDTPHFVFVGRVSQEKGIDVLDRYFIKYGLNDCWTFAGQYDEDSKFYKDYSDKAKFLGHVRKEKMMQIYQKSDVLIFPSLADGFGLSVIEALQSGVFVICSDSTGAKDLIIEQENGFVFKTGDEVDLNNKIRQYLNINKGISKTSIRATIKNQTWKNYSENLRTSLRKYLETAVSDE